MGKQRKLEHHKSGKKGVGRVRGEREKTKECERFASRKVGRERGQKVG